MKSVLHRATRADVVRDPFPHVVIDDALEPEVYAELVRTFPSDETLIAGRPLVNNANYHTPARELLSRSEFAPVWRELAAVHTSPAFFAEVTSLFGEVIRELYPQLDLNAETRVRDRQAAQQPPPFALDCQIAWTSPVTVPSTSNRCHVDREVALYAGLLYMRPPHDRAPGGDLVLYRFRGAERAYDALRFVDERLVEPVKVIPYAANRAVFFVHSPEALHGVTPRPVTNVPRLHVNFLAERPSKIWSVGIPPAGPAASRRPAVVSETLPSQPARTPALHFDESTAVIVCAGPSLERLTSEAWRQLERAGAVVGVNGAPASEACVRNGVRFTVLAAMDIAHGLSDSVPGLGAIWRTTSAWRVTSVEARDAEAESFLVEVDEDDGVHGWSDFHDQGYKGGSTAMVVGNWLGNAWPADTSEIERIAAARGRRHPRRGFRTLAFVGLDMHFHDGRHASGAGMHTSGFAEKRERYDRVCESWGKLCAEAARRGIETVNLSPGTALETMTRRPLPESWLLPAPELQEAS